MASLIGAAALVWSDIRSVSIDGLLGLSLANAVFVDETTMDDNRELEARVTELTAEVRARRPNLDRDSPDPGN